ncbi:unnamed protein product [Moneuplotes crassus]|uniref:Uncharacterized protein n=1 Tax=Euplotes crassus TaxID=5936 RepID=A0AAD1US24_EUPCR|nr:unnamed protein product [Moneuplotes crassus]
MSQTKNFLHLRNKLNCLHYSDPLSKESCALVGKLLAEIAKMTENFQKEKTRADTLENTVRQEQIALLPLQKENARVVRENNSLHKEIITVKENLAQNDNSWQKQFRQLESEYNDIKNALKMKDFELKNLRNRNRKLEEKLGGIVKQNTMTNGWQVAPSYSQQENEEEPTSRPKMEMTYMLEKQTSRELESAEEENLFNQVCEADTRLQITHNELNAYRQLKEETDLKFKQLESMIHERDKEISRLNNLYTGTETTVQAAFHEKDNQQTIAKLNSQLDFINKENNRLQSIIEGLKTRKKSAPGLYKENRKAGSKLEKLQKGKFISRALDNEQLRRQNEACENQISQLQQKETSLTKGILLNYVDKNKYLAALQTISLHEQQCAKLKTLITALENQQKLQTLSTLKKSFDLA